ncbi:dihydroorotate dehydrogenase (quinone), mitochondrial-like [Athalia rosae]|uniref:dihydroorotate dehydrogenase (quinone), mitochondrial-like n=1 Tax=Athalia rosae TaxID=37344 RepID=UPI002033B352|nr:dihydroorotate dehydrogenase (quinone), mitochondrial-like [Athalia rosae]
MVRRLTSKEKIQAFIRVTGGGLVIFSGVNICTGNEKFYDNVVMPLVRFIDPETSHNIAIAAAKFGFISNGTYHDPIRLKTTVWGLNFNNPLGIAAGFDKQGEAVDGLHKIGFGFVEVGSVTPVPQDGNAKPRVFRLTEDKAVINRYGFNSDGHQAVFDRLQNTKSHTDFTGIIGVNLGKNKTTPDHVQDYIDGIKKFGDVADYFVINVSSPNTPGLRALQDKRHLEELISKINMASEGLARKPPLLVKLAPDLSDQERQDIADIINSSKCRIDGLVISNTTIQRSNLISSHREETGGLSGAPLTHLSTAMIRDMYCRTNGKIPIIGVGGIFTGEDAYEKIKAGATLVQIYTSYIYHGPPIVKRIKKELDELLIKDGYTSVVDAVGKDSIKSKT